MINSKNNYLESYGRNRGRWVGNNIWLGRKYLHPDRRRNRNCPFYRQNCPYYYENEDGEENENICPLGYHYHPEHKKSDMYGCMKDSDMVENYENKDICNKGIFVGGSILIFIVALFYMTKR